ncbi:MAG: PhoH family protein [Candidatus Competibacterales bacterium]|nr:PhoH family protein [Candidatus Competibacterales bacterium]
MRQRSEAGAQIFVLDTNVLMHDPTALFRFKEHDVYLPMMVLEELDRAKKGLSEIARNVRQVSRFLDELMAGASQADIEHGLRLPALGEDEAPGGRLYFQTRPLNAALPELLPGNVPDNDILSVAMALQQSRTPQRVTLVSKDINLRIKATILGIRVEDYYNDQVLDDVSLLYSGFWQATPEFWESHGREMEAWHEDGRTFYRMHGPLVGQWTLNQCVLLPDDPLGYMVREISGDQALLERLRDFTGSRSAVWGVVARNPEQNFALNLLLDPQIDFVTLLGAAGTGKTLLALAAGLTQTLDDKRYRDIVVTRVTVAVGEDIGFLPGTEEEKMTPWMGALMDNLEVLHQSSEGGSWGRAATQDLLASRIKIHALNYMRGRTFLGKYLIIDEAQNLTAKQMKTLITRAGPGTKVVCLGNIAQIDTPYLTETSSGLTYVVDRFRGWPHGGHVTLRRGERSRLAEFASDAL